ncbi:calcium-binding protein [Actinoplanes sp. NPDC049596]|uniref:calcium-binding protein n=1 Tax=unclassified Actinoplanes TaxID=2626549 RepID=UPI0034264560
MRKIYLAAVLAGAGLTAAFATPAQAASTAVAYTVADQYGDVIVYKAATGKANRVVVASGPPYYISIDDKFPIRAGKGCKAVKGDRTRVLCGAGELTERVQVSTFDRGDSIVNKTRLRLIAYGGTGNDTIRGSSSGDVIHGGSGADTAYGNGGPDALHGEAGNDALYGGAGNDRLFGGPGKDKLRGGPGKNHVVG